MPWFIWALLSALFAGITAVLAKLGVRDVDSNLATALRTCVILLFTWGIALSGTTQSLKTIPTQAWLFIGLSGIATGASWLCYFRALQLGEVAKVAPLDKLSVVIAMLLGALLLGEALTWKHVFAGALIVSGALLLIKA